jgi:hypothetical protein
MGTVGSTGNEFVFAVDAFYSLQKIRTTQKGFQKGYDGRMVSNQCFKFIDNVLWDSSS